MKPIEKLSVLITGGGSGIGAATAQYFAERGAMVTISGRRRENLEAVASSIGATCAIVPGDVTCAADREAMVATAVAHGGKLDALVNNAGNMYRSMVEDLEEQKVLDIMNTNVVSPLMLTQTAMPHLSKAQGAVIFVGSIHTRRAFPGASPYAASKAAIQTLTKVLAAELGSQKVRVNCVIPGAVPTEINIRAGLASDIKIIEERLNAMIPIHALDRIGKPEEIAEAIDYLIRAEWTTGALLDVDGGLGLGLA